MPHDVTIRRIGDALGIPLPDDLLAQKDLKEGDRVHLVETHDGLLIVAFDSDFEEAMDLYEEGAAAYSDVLEEMAND